jgi:hypothetical protein
MRTFYRVTPHLGYVPAGIRFVHRDVEYSTARIIGELLPPTVEAMPRLALKKSHWAGDDRAALEAKFVRLTRTLEGARSPGHTSCVRD